MKTRGLSVGKPLTALATGSCLALTLFVGATALRGSYDNRPQPPRTTAGLPAAFGQRLFYPPDRSQHVSLPGGRTEVIRSVLNISTQMRYGSSVWDDANVPQGPVWVRVDLTHQLLSVFRAGHEIGTAVILYGAADKQSPVGTYPVLAKAADYHSRTYDAAMPFSLRLTADGVAIHGADVQRSRATHGCIGVPTDFARRLFAEVKINDPVVIVKPAR